MSEPQGCTIFWDSKPRVAFQTDEALRFAELESDCHDIEVAANEIEHILRADGYAGGGAMLALPSRLCLAVALPPAITIDSLDHQALAYALEPLLPLAAEELTVAPVGQGRLCIATATDSIRPIIDALESRGIIVQSVCPAALLAVQGYMSNEDREHSFLLLWQTDHAVECFWIASGNVECWWQVTATEVALIGAIGMLSLGQCEPLHVKTAHMSDMLLERMQQWASVEQPMAASVGMAEAAAGFAFGILAGAASPWVELRSGPLSPKDRYRLVRGPLKAALVCAAILFTSTIAAMLVRGYRYRDEAQRFHLQQEEVFRAALPGQGIPPGIVSRLRSETSKLRAATGGLPSSSKAPASSLDALPRLLAALPADMKYRLSDIRLDGRQLNVDGETLSHGDADRIAVCLRAAGFEVEPPRSQQRADESIAVHWSALTVASNSQAESKRR